ncbi:lysostaphin resistance A-like protein [Arenibacterium sp. CAU 1754]
MHDRPYSAHERLVASARAHPDLWRLAFGLVLITTLTFFFGSVLRTFLMLIVPDFVYSQMDATTGQGNTPASLLILLFSFGLVAIAVFIVTRVVHLRQPIDLFGPLPLAIYQFWRVLRILLLLGVFLAVLPPYDMGEELVRNLDFGTWLILLPLSLTAVLVQVSAEEILFRGYLQQSLAARFSNSLIWLFVPALIFGLGHYAPAEAGDNAILLVAWATIFGLLMADLTARAGTLGPAIALHFANNVTAVLIVSVPDSLSGLSLATTPYSISDAENIRSWLMIDFAFMIVNWLAARVAIRR